MNKVLLTRQRKVRRVWMRQLLILLSVIGPGLITANVDNDATGITGYSLYAELFSHFEERGIFRLEAPETREEA